MFGALGNFSGNNFIRAHRMGKIQKFNVFRFFIHTFQIHTLSVSHMFVLGSHMFAMFMPTRFMSGCGYAHMNVMTFFSNYRVCFLCMVLKCMQLPCNLISRHYSQLSSVAHGKASLGLRSSTYATINFFSYLLCLLLEKNGQISSHWRTVFIALPHSPIVEQAPSIAALSKLGESHHAHMCV